MFPDFVPRHIYEYAYVKKSVQLNVSLLFSAPHYGFYFTIWVQTEDRINKTVDKLPLETQTLYAELMEQLVARDAYRSIGYASGCFTKKDIRGSSYYYFQYSDPGDVQRQLYIGKKSNELDTVVERYKTEREAFKVDEDNIRRLCAQLRVGGAFITDTASARVIKSLAESGVFHLEGVLLGTQCFSVFGNLLGVTWKGSAIKTFDIDIAGKLKMSIALPNIRADIPKALKSLEMGFIPVPALNPKASSTSFKVRGKPLRVDFVTPEIKPGENYPVFISRFNSAAQPLRFLDHLIDSPVKAAIIDGGGVLVNVPQPARFAFHKLIISQERELTAHDKVEKDIIQAAQVISVLADERPGDLLLAWDEIKRRGKGWIKRAKAGMSMIHRSHPSVYKKAVELLGL